MSELSVISLKKASEEQPAIDVLFVHGLGGDIRETWHPKNKPDVFWPDWLAEDNPQMAVWSLGYPAEATKWSGEGAGMALPDRAKQVLDYLVSLGFGKRPLIFITHSLGGLLVKQLLRSSAEFNLDRYQDISKVTRAVIFLATPHSGSDLANIARKLSLLSRPTKDTEDLQAHNPYLLALSDWYRNNATRLDINTFSYRENKKIQGAWVVNPTSAEPGITGSMCIPQEEDHFSIAKPTSRTHPVYAGVRNIVATLYQTELEKKKLTLQVHDYEVTVEAEQLVPAEKTPQTDSSEKWYVDDDGKFRFLQPLGKNWNKPRTMNYWTNLSESLGLPEEQIEEIKPILCIMSPMGKMISDSKVFDLTFGNPITPTLTDTTSTRAMEGFVNRTLEYAGEEDEETLGNDEITGLTDGLIKSTFPSAAIKIQNSFSVNTFDKDLLPGPGVKTNLPTLFLELIKYNNDIDNLAADQNTIMWGNSTTLKNVVIENESRELTVYRMNLLTESDNNYFCVSIAYSPQTEDSIQVWSQLQSMFKSFQLTSH